MKRILVFSLICALSGLLTVACGRAQAGREEGNQTYQPRPAPKGEVVPGTSATSATSSTNRDIKGELMRIDMKNNTMTVRAENGMEQTVKFNDQTMVQGVEQPKAGTARGASMQMQSLMGKEGSEVTVMWRDEAGAKMATSIHVDSQVTSRNPERSKKQGRY